MRLVSLYSQYTVRLVSLCNQYKVRLVSLYSEYTVRLVSLCKQYTVRLVSLWNQYTVRLVSLCNQYTVRLVSLYNQYTVRLVSLDNQYKMSLFIEFGGQLDTALIYTFYKVVKMIEPYPFFDMFASAIHGFKEKIHRSLPVILLVTVVMAENSAVRHGCVVSSD